MSPPKVVRYRSEENDPYVNPQVGTMDNTKILD